MKLTLNEILILSDELNGRVINPATQQKGKGLLSQKLSIRVKYALSNEINKKVIEFVKEFEDAKNDLVKKFGNEVEGQSGVFSVPKEKLEDYYKDLNELLSIEKNIEVPDINIGELYNIETEDYYPLLLDKFLAKK
jgi:hypothetical protein